MTALLVSYVCDYCDGLAQIDWHTGFCVFNGDDDFSRPVLVFPSRTEAALYRSVKQFRDAQIREIRFEVPVRWKLAIGALDGVTIAAKPFELHRDHRFQPLPYHGYLVPISTSP
jgi:hypothetical protein